MQVGHGHDGPRGLVVLAEARVHGVERGPVVDVRDVDADLPRRRVSFPGGRRAPVLVPRALQKVAAAGRRRGPTRAASATRRPPPAPRAGSAARPSPGPRSSCPRASCLAFRRCSIAAAAGRRVATVGHHGEEAAHVERVVVDRRLRVVAGGRAGLVGEERLDAALLSGEEQRDEHAAGGEPRGEGRLGRRAHGLTVDQGSLCEQPREQPNTATRRRFRRRGSAPRDSRGLLVRPRTVLPKRSSGRTCGVFSIRFFRHTGPREGGGRAARPRRLGLGAAVSRGPPRGGTRPRPRPWSRSGPRSWCP